MTMHLTRKRGDWRPDLLLDLPEPDQWPCRRVALVGTYPPTTCGIASYTANLRKALAAASEDEGIFAVVRMLQDGEEDGPEGEVVAAVAPDDPASVREGASTLAGYDLVLVQHEFGIYGPGSGRAVLDLVDHTGPPVITTFHTVMEQPEPEQREIIRTLGRRSEHVVVHSEIARRLLIGVYDEDPGRIEVIPHGATPLAIADQVSPPADPLLLTWGLIGPGKGLEWAVAALARLTAVFPGVRYVIAGRTHPKVVAREGEAYRRGILDLARRLGVERSLQMVDRYLSPDELAGLMGQASVVVLPYDTKEQTSSGVLTEAVSAGIPVVSTAFPHAIELAESGAVAVVPHRDPQALAAEIERLLCDAAARADMLLAQQGLAASADWDQVAVRYLDVIESALERSRA